jgi:hypothetical protein
MEISCREKEISIPPQILSQDYYMSYLENIEPISKKYASKSTELEQPHFFFFYVIKTYERNKN